MAGDTGRHQVWLGDADHLYHFVEGTLYSRWYERAWWLYHDGSLFPNTWNWHSFWNITALLAIVLAFMNIIPIPGLDGGHIVITLWEMITRKPVNDKVLDVIQKIGLGLLIALLVVANGDDLLRLFNGWFM